MIGRLMLMKRMVLPILMACLALQGAVTFASEAPRMDKKEVKKLLGNPDVVIIDVRAAGDWIATKEKIKGAARENPREFESWYGKYPKDKTIILYCA